METQTENQSTAEAPIPSSQDVKTPGAGGKAWRIASGKICRGKEGEDGYETRESIIGRLRRIGVHDGEHEGKRKKYLECDIETDAGKIRLHANLLDQAGKEKASGVAIAIAWGLKHIAKDTDLIITAFQGSKKNDYGSYPTFVNFYTLAPGATQGKPIPKREYDKGSNMDMDLAQLLSELTGHPAYALRPSSEQVDDDGNAKTHFAALCQECQAKGWPSPEQNATVWLSKLSEVLGRELASLSQVSDDEWGEIRQTFEPVAACPAWLAPAATQTKMGALV